MCQKCWWIIEIHLKTRSSSMILNLSTLVEMLRDGYHTMYFLCRNVSSLLTLKQTHAHLLTQNLHPIDLATHLIPLYTSFNDPHSALSLLTTLPQEPNTFLWNSIIKSYIDSGFHYSALSLYRKMQQSCIPHDDFTLPLVNRAVSWLPKDIRCEGMVHCVGIRMGFGRNVYFCNTLIELYVKNWSIGLARHLFDEMPERDLVSWTSMISGYVLDGDSLESFRLFNEMRMEGLEPNPVTLVILLRGCDVVQGRGLHGYVIKIGFESDRFVSNSILSMYSKNGDVKEVEIFFSGLSERDVVSWNIMISAYSTNGDSLRVAESFNKLRAELIPSVQTLTSEISAFAKSGSLRQGEKIHGYALKVGVCDIVLHTSLVDLYAKCGKLDSSLYLFSEIPQRNNITWSTMMSGLVQNGYFNEAIEVFREMLIVDSKPGIDSLRNLVLVYTHLGALQLGKAVHGFVIRNVFYSSKEDNTAMETSILNMFAKCGSIVNARRCFDRMVSKDVIAWSSMIEGYSNHGLGFEAITLFYQMVDEGVEPNGVTLLSLLSACSHSGLLDEGCRIFNCMSSRFGVKPDLNHYTCVVDLLGRSGKLEEALSVIENTVVEPDSRIWGALLAACKVHSNTNLGLHAAERLLELETDNAGYHTLVGNVHASTERWDETETVRRVMSENNLKKLPGWSCIEVKGRFHGFVARDDSHCQAGEIYEILESLNKTLEEAG